MNITVNAEKPADSKLVVTVTVASADVDAAVKKAYKDIANRYNFQGFRRGRAPRPIIDNMVGREAVLGMATEDIAQQVEPLMLTELDIVPVAEVDYSEVESANEHEDFQMKVTIPLIPEVELSSYDAVNIELPPAEATEDEINAQIDILLAYSTTFEDAPEGAGCADDDIVTFDIENIEGAEKFAAEGRTYTIGSPLMSESFYEAVKGMAVGDEKEIAWTPDGDDATEVKAKVTVKSIRQRHIPELTDELVESNFGFASIDELRDAVKSEIEQDKGRQIPQLKETRCLDALAERMDLEEVPEAYAELVYNELGQNVLQQMQQAGTSLDAFLAQRGISAQDFIDDLHAQADERARQSLALDAVARSLNIEVTDEDIAEEIADAGVSGDEAIAEMRKQLTEAGRMPAVRASIRRAKALDWLLDSAAITEVEEATKVVENDAE